MRMNVRFEDILKTVSQNKKIALPLIEKDYWIMHSLWGLQSQGFDFYMKGGTSLSKDYKVINRFSEDIDILISPPDTMDVKTGKNHMKPSHIESRKIFFDWLVENINIPGIESVEYDRSVAIDGKWRNGDILLNYNSHHLQRFPN